MAVLENGQQSRATSVPLSDRRTMKFLGMKYLSVALTSAFFGATLLHASTTGAKVSEPAQVTVVNPVTVTGKVETINDALKTPFHFTVSNRTGAIYTVPAGMRLTIESVSAYAAVAVGQKAVATLSVATSNTATPTSLNFLPLQSQGVYNDFDVFVSSLNLKIVVDSTAPQIAFDVYRTAETGFHAYVITLNGHLEQVP